MLAFALPWLVFTSFFFVKFFYVTPPVWEVLLSAAAISVFLASYFTAFRNYRKPRALRAPSFVMLGIGVLMAPVNPGANVFFSYPAWFLGRAYPPRQALLAIAGIGVLAVALTLVFDLDIDFVMPALLLSCGLGLMSLASRRFEETQQALRSSREEAEHLGRIAERERIARDLHDTIGHSLSVIALKSELAAGLARDGEPHAADEMLAVNRVARQSLAEIRATLSGYWELSLDAELKALTASLREAGIQTKLDVMTIDLPVHTETALAMCLREAVTNVIRHSEASACRIELKVEAESAVARVSDNGNVRTIEPGRGLGGMRQRVEQMSGDLQIAVQDGTRLVVRLPLTSTQQT
ncbi:MAG: sensor histidine kinase [Pseudomonadota bacterium]